MKMRQAVATMCLLALAASAQAFREKSPQERRQEILQLRGETLEELYGLRPDARDLIQRSEGYAVFSTKGMKILVAGGASGKGILIDNRAGAKTYMKMAQINVGLGYGLQGARLVFVFQDRKAMETFGSAGWDFSGKGDISAAAKGEGANFAGAVSFMPGVLVYQFTKNGLAVSLTLQGTKFWADEKLNS